jgi:hypothetical protein
MLRASGVGGWLGSAIHHRIATTNSAQPSLCVGEAEKYLMRQREQQPWVAGAAELLEHAVELLQGESPVRLRLALIATDNAVELALKTFLSLPKRVTGIAFPRKRFQEVSENFPALLDALEEVAPERLHGVDLASIEWYHRVRNQLYHQGYGLAVEREKVEIYAQLANALLRNLFGEAPLAVQAATELLGRFIELWARLEGALQHIASDHALATRPFTVVNATRLLRGGHIVPDVELNDIERLRRLRNEIVHGASDYKSALDQEAVHRLESIVVALEEVAGGEA